MINLGFIDSRRLISCKHVLGADGCEVGLVFFDKSECHFVCGDDNHSSYTDFIEVLPLDFMHRNEHLKFLNFPHNTNVAEYRKSNLRWDYSLQDKSSLSPVDGFSKLGKIDQFEFLTAIERIQQKQGVWIVRGPNRSIGGKTTSEGIKYIPIWTTLIPKKETFFSKFFKKKPVTNFEFITIGAFTKEFGCYFDSYEGFILHHNDSQFACPFEDVIKIG